MKNQFTKAHHRHITIITLMLNMDIHQQHDQLATKCPIMMLNIDEITTVSHRRMQVSTFHQIKNLNTMPIILVTIIIIIDIGNASWFIN